MAVTVDLPSVTTATGTVSTTLTFAVTCAGTNRCLIVGVGSLGSIATTATCTYAGVSMTLVDAKSQTSGNQTVTFLFSLVVPATGTNNVIVTFSSSRDYFAACAVNFNGVDQTTPVGTDATAYDNGGVAHLAATVTSASSGMCIDSYVVYDNTLTATADGGQTERGNVASGSAGYGLRYGMSTAPGAASVAMGWTKSATTWPQAIIVAPINAISIYPTGGFNFGCGTT